MWPSLVIPPPLVLLPDNVTVYVLEEYQRNAPLVAELNELGGLERALGEKNTVVPQNPYWIAVDVCPAANQGGAIEGLELKEFAPVNHPGDDFADIIRCAQVPGNDTINLFWVIERGLWFPDFYFCLLRGREILDYLADDLNTVGIVFCEIVGDP